MPGLASGIFFGSYFWIEFASDQNSELIRKQKMRLKMVVFSVNPIHLNLLYHSYFTASIFLDIQILRSIFCEINLYIGFI